MGLDREDVRFACEEEFSKAESKEAVDSIIFYYRDAVVNVLLCAAVVVAFDASAYCSSLFCHCFFAFVFAGGS